LADQKIELEIVLDDGSIKRAFGTIRKEADDTAPKVNNAFAVNGLADFTAGLYLASKALAIVKGAAIELIDTVLSGEKIDAINKRFQILSEQQLLNADALSAAIAASVEGTVDMEDALESTSNSLINLQTGLNQIPKLFEIARKSASVFGGDTVSNFEAIQQSIISGNTRQLKTIGIFIDSAKAVSDYEKSIGAAKDGLTEAGRQQAILNQVLKVSEESFKNITTSISPVDEALKKFNVSFGEVGDTIANVTNKAFGTSFAGMFSKASSVLDLMNIKMREFLLGEIPKATDNIKLLNNELNLLMASREQQSLLANSEEMVSVLDREIAAKREKLLVEQQIANQQATANANLLAEKPLNEEKLIKTRELTYELIELRKAQEEYDKVLKKQADDAAAAANQINQSVKNALVNGIANSIQLMTNALFKGQNALEAIGRGLLVLFADLAIEVGKVMLATGIGMLALKFLDPTGAIAAGLGLIAVGSILKSAIGSGEQASTTLPSGGGFGYAGGNDFIEQNNIDDTRVSPNSVFNLTIQGDVLDSDATGSRIVQLLNSAIDTKGAVVRGFA
jgi:hypothetical protein